MGVPISVLQHQISSKEFQEYLCSYILDPDIGTRLDGLLSIIAHLLTRLEYTLGGKPPQLDTPLIAWGQDETDRLQEEEVNAISVLSKLGTKRV